MHSIVINFQLSCWYAKEKSL